METIHEEIFLVSQNQKENFLEDFLNAQKEEYEETQENHTNVLQSSSFNSSMISIYPLSAFTPEEITNLKMLKGKSLTNQLLSKIQTEDVKKAKDMLHKIKGKDYSKKHRDGKKKKIGSMAQENENLKKENESLKIENEELKKHNQELKRLLEIYAKDKEHNARRHGGENKH